jgi:hypothetical protein
VNTLGGENHDEDVTTDGPGVVRPKDNAQPVTTNRDDKLLSF